MTGKNIIVPFAVIVVMARSDTYVLSAAIVAMAD
jgi:hypothetical protein